MHQSDYRFCQGLKRMGYRWTMGNCWLGRIETERLPPPGASLTQLARPGRSRPQSPTKLQKADLFLQRGRATYEKGSRAQKTPCRLPIACECVPTGFVRLSLVHWPPLGQRSTGGCASPGDCLSLGPGFDASDDPEKGKCRLLHPVTGDLI